MRRVGVSVKYLHADSKGSKEADTGDCRAPSDLARGRSKRRSCTGSGGTGTKEGSKWNLFGSFNFRVQQPRVGTCLPAPLFNMTPEILCMLWNQPHTHMVLPSGEKQTQLEQRTLWSRISCRRPSGV